MARKTLASLEEEKQNLSNCNLRLTEHVSSLQVALDKEKRMNHDLSIEISTLKQQIQMLSDTIDDRDISISILQAGALSEVRRYRDGEEC